MVHNMRLENQPFCEIRDGKKTIEIRIFDDKRRRLDVGDKIIFTNLSDQEQKIAVNIKALYRYGSFRELFEEISSDRCGNLVDSSVEELVEKMREYYSEEDEAKCGVLGIKIELANLQVVLREEEAIAEVLYNRWFPDGEK